MGPIAREGFPLGPNRGAYILAKEIFRAVVFLDASLKGPLCKPKGCHTGPMARKAFQKARIESPIFVQRKFSGLFGFEC